MAVTVVFLGFIAAAYISWWLLLQLRDPLRDIPGPRIARFTKLWYFYRAWLGHWNEDIIRLHRKYGKIVRYAPGQYSFSDPSVAKDIFGYGSGLEKARAYEAWNPPGQVTLFNATNNKVHGELRRKLQHQYSMTNISTYEKSVESCIDLLTTKLEDLVGKRIDLTFWTHCFVSDTMALLTFGKRFGSLDRGEDVGGLSVFVRAVAEYATLMGIVVEWHWWYYQLAGLWTKISGTPATSKLYLTKFTLDAVARRKEERASGEMKQENAPNSMLDQFLDANDKDPSQFEHKHIMIGLGGNIVAGSDTTSGAMTAAFFYLSKNPAAKRLLRKELQAKIQSGNSASSLTLADVQAMPYLNAVITETLRLFPQTGLGLPRAVPAGGADIGHLHFGAGNVVNMSSWAAHYDEDNFGPDAGVFRPERWLEADKERKDQMNKAWFPFGLGSRNCLGRNIAMLTMLKALPVIVSRFDFELSGGARDHPEAIDEWVIRPTELYVRVSKAVE